MDVVIAIENKEIEDVKQKIADIIGEAYYNLTAPKDEDLKSMEQSDSESDKNRASPVDNRKHSDQ